MDAKNYLVTGGAGFVGSHLVDELSDQGHYVEVLDDLSNGSTDNLPEGVKLHPNDISEIQEINYYRKFHGIFHLATSPRSFSVDNPMIDTDVNCKGMLNVIKFALQQKAKIVFTSNSGIGGSMKDDKPLDEDSGNFPSTPYDANKLVCEYYCKIYNKLSGLKSTNVRFATVFGNRQVINEKLNWRPLVITFLRRMQLNKSVYINWDGKQTRDLLYVKDAVQGLVKAMACKVDDGSVFILSTKTETSVQEVFDVIAKKTGYTQEPIYNDMIPGDVARMCHDYSKARGVLGYKPLYNFRSAIDDMLKD